LGVLLCSTGIAVFVFRTTLVLPTRAVAAAQRSLAESEQKYRGLFLSTHEAVLLLELVLNDTDATIVEANPRLQQAVFEKPVQPGGTALWGDVWSVARRDAGAFPSGAAGWENRFP
jgi:hypothetical protein